MPVCPKAVGEGGIVPVHSFENLLSFAQKRAPFSAQPFGEADNLLFSQLSFFPWDGIVPAAAKDPGMALCAAARALWESGAFAAFGRQNHALVKALLENPVFRTVQVCAYTAAVDLTEAAGKQFAAVTFLLPDGTCYVAFRGTDAYFAGWSEDVSLTYLEVTPSQKEGLSYLLAAAAALPRRRLRVGGHSKGGNIALYAALHSPENVRARILAVYNNDGPGFLQQGPPPAAIGELAPRIHTFLPQGSTVGMLLSGHPDPVVVYSRAHGGGVSQHDPFSWQVQGTRFVRAPGGLTRRAALRARVLNGWITSVPCEKRACVAQSLQKVLLASGVSQRRELSAACVAAMVRAAAKLGGQTWHDLRDVFVLLLRAAVKR